MRPWKEHTCCYEIALRSPFAAKRPTMFFLRNSSARSLRVALIVSRGGPIRFANFSLSLSPLRNEAMPVISRSSRRSIPSDCQEKSAVAERALSRASVFQLRVHRCPARRDCRIRPPGSPVRELPQILTAILYCDEHGSQL